MKNRPRQSSLRLTAIAILLLLCSGGVFADNKYKQGQEYRYDHKQYRYDNDKYRNNRYDNDRYRYEQHRARPGKYSFYKNDRRLINEYYRDQQYRGKCPRGFTKKHNRCQPPRHAKKWHKGRPLAHNVKYYKLPNHLYSGMQPPPRDYRYVRVDNDILMVDALNNIVVDAIENIFR